MNEQARNCINFNYGMVITISIYFAFVASFEATTNVNESYKSCEFYSKVIYYFGSILLMLGVVGDLLLDIAKVFKSVYSIHQDASLLIFFPNESTWIFATELSHKTLIRSKSKKCIIYALIIWTIAVRVISNMIIAISLPLLTLFNFLDNQDCILHMHDPSAYCISAIIALLGSLSVRLCTTASFQVKDSPPDPDAPGT